MLKFQYRYFILAVLIFFIEVFIAVFIHDEIIRPHIGDFLVVILIYCFLKSFLKLSFWKTAIVVLIFAYAVEVGQYFKIVEKLNLQNTWLEIIIGTSFSWIDILAYTVGIGFVLLVEGVISNRHISGPQNNPVQ